MTQFRTYQLALELYQEIEVGIKRGAIKGVKRDQLERAALSVPLNLSEGSAKPTIKERKRFYYIALGSFRETQCLIKLCGMNDLDQKVDKLGAHLYKLCHSR